MDSYLIYGPPGSGKTKISQAICMESGIRYLSVGEITRREIANNTETGRQLKYYLDIPLEYPVNLIAGLVEREISDSILRGKSFLLDGFPKYSWEASHFVRYINQRGIKIAAIIVVELDLETALLRVQHRYICTSCQQQYDFTSSEQAICAKCGKELIKRDDDEEVILKRRYQDYTTSIEDTLSILAGHYVEIIRVNAVQPYEGVLLEIKNSLKIN